jgi:hypothetical protein
MTSTADVHTRFSYNGRLFDLGTKNANLLVAFIGSSPTVPEVTKYIAHVYGPNIKEEEDTRTGPTQETIVQEVPDKREFKEKSPPKPLVFPDLPPLKPSSRNEIDQKLEEILPRVSDKNFEFNEQYKQKLISRSEALLYDLYRSENKNASKVLQQELDTKAGCYSG